MPERNHIVSLLSLTTLEIKVRNFVFINTESIHKKWEKLVLEMRNGTAELKVLLKCVHCVIMSKTQMVIHFFTFAWPSEILEMPGLNGQTFIWLLNSIFLYINCIFLYKILLLLSYLSTIILFISMQVRISHLTTQNGYRTVVVFL